MESGDKADWIRLLAERQRNEPLPPDDLGEWIRLLREDGTPVPQESVRDWLWLQLVERRGRPPLSPLECTRKFLFDHVFDAVGGLDDVRADVARAAASDPRPIREALHAMEALIAAPPHDGTLSWIIAFDANWSLDDAGDSGAIEALYQVKEVVRDVLDSLQD